MADLCHESKSCACCATVREDIAAIQQFLAESMEALLIETRLEEIFRMQGTVVSLTSVLQKLQKDLAIPLVPVSEDNGGNANG